MHQTTGQRVGSNVILMKTPPFTCPYSNLPLTRPCEVSSCSYNLDDNAAAKSHNRCFLSYTDAIRRRPTTNKNEHDFNAFPPEKKVKTASQFFGVSQEEVERINADFYLSLFSVFAEDVSISLKKHQLDPVPYKQCAVCGTEEEELFMPGVLPSGWGYCSYACFQLKPPPILMVEKNMDLDFGEFVRSLEYESHQGRAKFVRQMAEWVLGTVPMRL